MEAATSLVPFYQELTPEEQRALRAALDADPNLADAFRIWRRVRASMRTALERAVPDRHLLVLYALDLTGRVDGFTASEREALAAARPMLASALHRHPVLQTVVDRIQDEVEAFEAVWEAETAAPLRRPLRRTEGNPLRAIGWEAVHPPRRRVVAWSGRIAAILAVLAVSALLFLSGPVEPAPLVVQTGDGEVRMVELPDGSRIRLMGDSQLRYVVAGDDQPFDRQVRFQGQAYFKIRTDPAHPFTVETPEARAVVLGTEFGMAAHDDETEVVLAEGKVELVALDDPADRVVLAPREKARVVAGEKTARPVAVDLVDELGWTGLFVFKEEPYEDVAHHLGRHYGVRVEIDERISDPAFGATGLTGDFAHTDELGYILETIPVSDDRLRVVALPDGGFRLTLATD